MNETLTHKNSDFRNFEHALKTVLSTSHTQLKAMLDKEKRSKRRKKARASALGRASSGSR